MQATDSPPPPLPLPSSAEIRQSPGCNEAYTSVLEALLSHQHVFFSIESSSHPPIVPQSSTSRSSQSQRSLPTISSLSLHPTIEACLHLLNADLSSAHFLLRHMETAPAWESMYLHGILHRIEGDIDNARAWYGDVEQSDVFTHVWDRRGAGLEESKTFLSRVERWRDRGRKRRGTKGKDGGDVGDAHGSGVDWHKEEAELRDTSFEELLAVLRYCEKKFGIGRLEDARAVYTEHGAKSEIAKKMIIGGEGWRVF